MDVKTPQDEILRVENVWRRYHRWTRRPDSLKEAMVRLLNRDMWSTHAFWALRDVSFSVRRGEVVGFCGANGAGKSTLLQVLARIVPMTYGRITVRGTIATLLELGTGFLPDLSGRENIRLNGALMGLRRAEIERKIDSIIAFADLGEFIDSPVKTYSSGMYMRLGFAIASHVEADILLLDEVLAVGDAEFHKKCMAWLQHLCRNGTTVLIVSHALPMLLDMCHRVLWLDQGCVMAEGPPEAVLQKYCPDLIGSGI